VLLPAQPGMHACEARLENNQCLRGARAACIIWFAGLVSMDSCPIFFMESWLVILTRRCPAHYICHGYLFRHVGVELNICVSGVCFICFI